MRTQVYLWIVTVSLGLAHPAFSEKVPPGTTSQAPEKKKAKGNKTREKDAEGTQAPHRFDQETIIKSQYELDGQALEVDTD